MDLFIVSFSPFPPLFFSHRRINFVFIIIPHLEAPNGKKCHIYMTTFPKLSKSYQRAKLLILHSSIQVLTSQTQWTLVKQWRSNFFLRNFQLSAVTYATGSMRINSSHHVTSDFIQRSPAVWKKIHKTLTPCVLWGSHFQMIVHLTISQYCMSLNVDII